MVLPTGKACAFSSLFLEMEKVYEAELKLGVSTDSGDTEGEILSQLSDEEMHQVWEQEWEEGRILREEISNLRYLTEQTAPEVSALKHKGKRLSDLYREGREVPQKTRKISVGWVEIVQARQESTIFKIQVSSGTYIRKMAMDLGEKLGVPISLQSLKRISVGDSHIQNAKIWENTEIEDGIPIQEMVDFPSISLTEEKVSWVRNGRKPSLSIEALPTNRDDFFLEDSKGGLLAWCRKKNSLDWDYMRVFR